MLQCPYCFRPAVLVRGPVVYPHRPDLAPKCFWRCAPCDAYVGCHPGTQKPLGRLANAELRAAKQLAHSYFDRLWREGRMTRKEAYRQLGESMGLPAGATHIGMFDVEQCNKAAWFAMEKLDAPR